MVDYVLKASLENQQMVTIIYQQDKKFTERNIKVKRIDGSHIEAFCYLRHQCRISKKENILSAYLNT